MRYGHIVVLVLSFSVVMARAQEGTGIDLRGKIHNGNGKPLSSVSISIDSLGISAVSDTLGQYVIKHIPPGIHIVSVSCIGYKTALQKIVATDNGKELMIDFILTEDHSTLREITVQSKIKTQQIKESGFNVNVIDTKPYENRALGLNQILNQTTGVRIRENGGLGSGYTFYLNGMSGSQVKFFIDGQPMEDFGAVFGLHNIPANMVERIEVYKGAVPIQFGSDALGGAVNIVTKQKTRNYLDASYSYGSFNTHRANITGQYRMDSGFTVKPGFYYNYSDNTFMLYQLKTRLKSGVDSVGDFRRFLSNYQSYKGDVELGFTGKKWADHLLADIGYGEVKSNIINASGNRDPYGNFILSAPTDAYYTDKNTITGLRYMKKNLFFRGLDVNFSGSYTYQNNINHGTSGKQYNWLGELIRDDNRLREIRNFRQHFFQQTSGIAYRLNHHHTFNFNFTSSYLERSERYLTYPEKNSLNPLNTPNTLSKKVYGLSHDYKAFNDKLLTTLSLKYFDFGIYTRVSKSYSFGQLVIEDKYTGLTQPGYGLATSYKINDNWLVKGSFEKTYRLPEAVEIFGNGFNTLSNTELQPESSNNFNAGVLYQAFADKNFNHKIFAEANGFLWLVNQMIFLNSGMGSRFNVYSNIEGVHIRGADMMLGYAYRDKFALSVNATYQDVLNNIKYETGTTIPNFVYRDRMYNTPWLFGNADAAYTFTDIGKKKLRLNVLYSLNYVNEFYLNYPSIARAGEKYVIPTQVVQNAAVTFSSEESTYNISLECLNIFDKMTFDNFAVQKPGRSFSVKVRYYLLSKKKV